MSDRQTKTRCENKKATQARLIERKAAILKALAHPTRIAIFEALAQGEKSVGELVTALGLKDANASQHLALMRAAGLLGARKDGLNVYYSIRLSCLAKMLSCIDEGVCHIADEHGMMADMVRTRAGAKR